MPDALTDVLESLERARELVESVQEGSNPDLLRDACDEIESLPDLYNLAGRLRVERSREC